MTRGHLPSVVAEIETVLRHHGFGRINTRAIESLVQGHKEAFIDDLLTPREALRTEALWIDDLVVIAAVLKGYVSHKEV